MYPQTLMPSQEIALYVDEHGLALIHRLIEQAAVLLPPGRHMLLESDIRQHDAIIHFAQSNGFAHVQTAGLITHFTRKA